MEIRWGKESAAEYQGGAVAIPVFEDEPPMAGFEEWFASGETAGKAGEFTLLHRASGYRATRVLLVGAGKRTKFTPPEMRKLAGAAVRFAKSRSIKTLAFALEGQLGGADFASAAVEGALLGNYEGDRLKSDKTGSKFADEFTVLSAAEGAEQGVRRGQILGEAQNWARSLANEPPNLMTPTVLAQRAREMADTFGLGYEVLDEAKMRELGMGALLGVAMGSAEPPQFIIVRYMPETEIHRQCSSRADRKRCHVRHRRRFDQAGRQHGQNEI